LRAAIKLQSHLHGFSKPFWAVQLTSVAYFSMEFMLSEALPIYSGGLGNVAGDQLKTASDLGVPVVAWVALPTRYFRQVRQGWSTAGPFSIQRSRPTADKPVREPTVSGCDWSLRCRDTLSGYGPGRSRSPGKAYLLDSNDPANFPARRDH